MPTVRRNSCEKIMGFGETVAKMQRVTIDRISELPEFILHTILVMLDPKEAGRASVLSKRWYEAWSSIPVLNFQLQYFTTSMEVDFYERGMAQRLMRFIDKTMQRYFTEKYKITEMYLAVAIDDKKTATLVDKWIMIAVQNPIQKLEIEFFGRYDYMLPEILFCAKSLKYLKCSTFCLPYYETMDLPSLEYLTLNQGLVDVDMLHKIISFCPLVELYMTSSRDHENDSLPWMGKVNGGAEGRGSGTMQAPLLKKFVGYGYCAGLLSHMVALKSLKKLELECAPITDDILSELVYGLVALETLVLIDCSPLKCIKISSNSLKQFRIEEGSDLMEVTIDTPNLLEFSYNCEMEISLSLISVLDHCNAQFCPLVEDSVNTVWFLRLKKFLIEMNLFNSLVMDLWQATGAFLDGLFWCCHPDVLSTRLHTLDANKLILDILKRKVQCWKHPLRSVEVEGVDCSNLFSESSDIEVRFRLSWF
ncbi:F-box/FBD/LRR-repeat protein At1g78750-like isoform X2 [Silene latifolia]|uniref:F-box/FBD/LRR-repeat protein At1g78750-like isoform X2 n=1 Tax=Silene latifolia TaxID=37657 RepID=UPI003D773EC3